MKVLRTCRDCGVEAHTEEELDLFAPYKQGKYGRARWCKSCKTEYYYKNRTSTIDRNTRNKRGTFKNKREQVLFLKYKILPEEYKELLTSQNYKCKICGCNSESKRNGGHKHLAVDHCHKTKKVRGLLCMRCNTALGNMEDNISIIKKMIEYITLRS